MTGVMVPTLLLATSNPGKRREMEALLAGMALVVTFGDLGLPSPAEVGTTFAENARIKASFGADATGLPTLADDSGLDVDALEGAPGVFSARYAGQHATDAMNRAKLLANLESVPADHRGARFHAAVAIALPGRIVDVFEATCEGSIARDERGDHGFGYDPVFALPDGRRMAELDPSEKNRISHRAQAIELALPTLRRVLINHSPQHMQQHEGGTT